MKKDEGFGIQAIVQTYLRNWPLMGILLVFGLADAWLYLQVTPKKYLTTASILIKDEKKGLGDAKMVEAMDQLATNKIVENEIIVLKSKEMMNQVIENLHLYAAVYSDDLFKDKLYYEEAPFKVIAKQPSKLLKCEKMTVIGGADENTLIIAGNTFQYNQWIRTNYGVLKFEKGNLPLLENQAYTVKLETPKKLTELLTEDLEASAVNKLASVINLQIRDEEPKRAEDIITELIRVYNASSLKAKNLLAVNTLAVVNERLAVAAADLDSIELKLEGYKSSTGSVDISSQSKFFLQNVSDNDQKLADVERKIRALKDIDRKLSTSANGVLMAPSSMDVDDPILRNLISTLYETELQYEDLKSTTAVNSPIMKGLKDKIEKVKPVIKQNLVSTIRSLEQNRNSLGRANDQYSGALNTMPTKEKDIIAITREQNKKLEIYNFLLEKREDAALSLSATVSDSRVIDQPRTTVKPVSPRALYVYPASLLLSFLIGSLLIALKGFLKKTIMDRSQIEEKLEMPIVAEISQDNSHSPIVTGMGKRSEIAEQFRRLRSALPYIGIRGNRKRILITSSISEEGKSFIAINLAISMAIAGKKVALIEFDLLNPSICRKLNLNYAVGMTDYIEGKCLPYEIVNRYAGIDNLFIVPAGTDHDNPSELLLNKKVSDILAYLDNEFDYLILDSAPVGLLSDAYVLGEHCDATLFVIRHRMTPKSMLDRITADMAMSSLKNLSIVYNGVKQHNSISRPHYKKYQTESQLSEHARLKQAVN